MRKTHTGVCLISGFLVNPLWKKIVITPEPVMILTWNFDQWLVKKNKATSKKFDDDVLSENCDIIVIFPIYAQFGAIQKQDSGCVACITYIFINSNLLKLISLWCWKVYFLKLHMCVHLRTKFHVSSIILTGFRKGEF